MVTFSDKARFGVAMWVLIWAYLWSFCCVDGGEIINNGDVCYRMVNEMTMCSKGWQDTGGCNGNCDSVSKCATHVDWGTPGFLVDRGNYDGNFCAQCDSVEEIGGGNNNYDLYEYVDCPAFVKRSCRAPAPEGNSLGDYGNHNGEPKSLDECKALCLQQSACMSFVFSEAGQKCHLKDKIVSEDGGCADGSSWNFQTYYRATPSLTTAEPTTAEPTAEPTIECCECPAPSAHYVHQGYTDWTWGSAPDYYCNMNDNTEAAYPTSYHDKIAVGCCYEDANGAVKGARPDCNAHPSTYDEAEALCSAHDMRLCTLAEQAAKITAGTGCWYNAAYEWVSDECDLSSVSADASASHSVQAQVANESVDGTTSIGLGLAAGLVVVAVGVGFVVGLAVGMARRKRKEKQEEIAMTEVVAAPKVQPAESMDGVDTI